MPDGELSTSRDIQAGMTEGSVQAPTVYNPHINDTPQIWGVYN
jgi:hypothetical protein